MYIRFKNINKQQKKSIFWKVFLVFTILLMFTTVFVQLFINGRLVTKSEEISYLEKRKNDLIIENIKLKSEIANANNLQVLKENALNFGFIPLEQKEVKYQKK